MNRSPVLIALERPARAKFSHHLSQRFGLAAREALDVVRLHIEKTFADRLAESDHVIAGPGDGPLRHYIRCVPRHTQRIEVRKHASIIHWFDDDGLACDLSGDLHRLRDAETLAASNIVRAVFVAALQDYL